jgi:hypothetical protein
MGDEPYTTQHETSTSKQSRPSSHSTSPHQAAYATERAESCSVATGAAMRMIRIFTFGDRGCAGAYHTDLIREVTDPNTGIQTTEKYMTFMPNAGELKVYCEGAAARRDRIQKLGALPRPDFSHARLPPPPPSPGDLANVFVPADNPRYASLLEWAKTADPRLFKI